jgi:hypothetical protein
MYSSPLPESEWILIGKRSLGLADAANWAKNL